MVHHVCHMEGDLSYEQGWGDVGGHEMRKSLALKFSEVSIFGFPKNPYD